MLGFNRWHLPIGLAAILCIGGIVSLALSYFIPAPPSSITMAVGFKGGSYELNAARYKRILARANVSLELLNTAGGAEHFKLLEDKNSGVQAAMVQGGISNDEKSPGLLSIGRINYQIFCLFLRASEELDDLTQLRGKRIAVGPVGSAGRLAAESFLNVSDVTVENSTLLPLAGQASINAIKDGNADVAILGLSSDSPLILSLLKDSGVRLMNVKRVEALSRFFPSLTRIVLPQGAIDFVKNIPTDDVVLFATTNYVVVRDDLDPTIIALLARALVETHGKAGLFQRSGEFPTQTDPEFSMAESASDFYKNGPSFLNRYLPLWMVPHAKRLLALLLAGGAIFIPIFNFAPKLYQWFLKDRVGRLYRRLRIVEEAAQTELSAPQVVSLQTELERIDRAARVLPQRHSDLFFIFEHHIILTRAQLASRLVEVRSQTLKLV